MGGAEPLRPGVDASPPVLHFPPRPVIEIPEAVRNKVEAAACAGWLDELPVILDDLASDWRLTIGEAYSGGTEAYVCRVRRHDGTAAVLKVLVPRDPALAEREAAVLHLADGDGCARLFAFDAGRQAFLMERLGPSLFDLRLPIRERHDILCDTAARLWRDPADADLPTGAWKARWLADRIERRWELLDRPCSEPVIEQALACAERRRVAHDDERARLVHGDVHEWNTLRAPGGRFKLVDPDGLVAEPEYDLGIIMREDPVELMAGPPDDRAHRLAARSGLDVVTIREWGIVERVSTGLLCTEIDLQPVGRQMLDAAEHVAATR